MHPQRVLRAYATKLITRLPKTAAGGTTGSAGAGTQDWYIRLNDEDVVVVCTIIATAEYCSEVVGALGRNVAKTLDPPFGAQVSCILRCSLALCSVCKGNPLCC